MNTAHKFQINKKLLTVIIIFLVLISILLLINFNKNKTLNDDYVIGTVISEPENASCREAIKVQIKAYNEDALSSSETFDKYKADVYKGPLSMLNPDISSSGARKFQTRINKELSKTGIDFGGKYSIVTVGMTGWGENAFIVDRTNGKGAIIPFRVHFFDSKADSFLLMLNHTTFPWDDRGGFDYEYACGSTGSPDEFYPDLRPHYYLWNGNEFLSIGNPAPINDFWKEWNLD